MSPVVADAPIDQIIVKFKEQARTTTVERGRSYAAAGSKIGAALKDVRATSAGARVLRAEQKLSDSDAGRLLEALRSDPDVEYAELDLQMRPAAADPNDSFYPLQWHLSAEMAGMRLPGAWDVSRGEGVVVAVVDTGITEHSDLNANVLPGYDMISNSSSSRDGDGRDANPRDEGDWSNAGQCGASDAGGFSSWHGTHVAGTVAAVTGNGQGVAGVAPAAKIVPIRALGACGGYTSDIADGIVWAAGGSVAGIPDNQNPAKVINLSLGGSSSCSYTYQSAIDNAVGLGAAVVVAAGNSNRPAAESTPANCENVIVVGASGRTGSRAPYSNYGTAVDVTAPGGDMTATVADGIASTINGGDTVPGAEAYAYSEGTSMAAPHVSGVAALLMSTSGGSLDPATVERRLKETTRPLPGVCLEGCGAGLVDAAAAVGGSNPTPAPEPQPELQLATGTPSIRGVVGMYRQLTAHPGEWGPAPVTFSYQWYADGAPIGGGQQLFLLPEHVNDYITVRVTGSKPGYVTDSRMSAPVGPVDFFSIVPGEPEIHGAAIVGETLSADPGNWSGDYYSLAYQWKKDGVPVAGGRSTVYTVTPADLRSVLTVTVTGSSVIADSASATSPPTDPVIAGTLRPAPIPLVSGETRVGKVLSAASGVWGPAPVTIAFQWYRSGIAIENATTTNYVLGVKDRGHAVSVAVTGIKAGYTSESRTSAATATILEDIVPAPVKFVDVDGTAGDSYTIPASEGVDYLVTDEVVQPGTHPASGSVTVVARPKAGFAFGDNPVTTWTRSFESTFNATPAPVVFTDKDGTAQDTYTVPAVNGVEYLVGGKAVAGGTYRGAGTVSVTARAKPDYVLKANSITSWSMSFKAVFRMNMTVAAGDLNGDGTADMLARDSGGTLWLYPGNGRGGWLARVQVGTGWNVMNSIVGAGDLNGDRKADALARDTAGTLWLYPGNGRGGWLARVRVGTGWNVMNSIVGPGDLNGDGKSDVLSRDSAGTLWIYPGNGRSGWLTRIRAGSGWNVMTAVVGPGDLNGDRKADVLARDTSGTLWLYPGNGRGGWLARVRAGSGWNAMVSVTGRGDFTGDGRNDVLAVDAAGTLWLYKGNGTGNWLGRTSAGAGWN